MNTYKRGFPKRFLILAICLFLEGVATLIVLMIHPHQPGNGIYLGYSMERWFLIGGVFLIQGLLVLLLLARRNNYWCDIEDRILKASWLVILFLVIFLVLLGLTMVGYYGNTPLLLRLCPVLIYGSLISIQAVIFQLSMYRNITQFGEEMVGWLDRKNFLLWLALLGAVPLLFANVVRYKYPLGFAGMWTLMAEQIVGANFHLPMSVPFYGPGGIPFAYPPLGLYLMAGFLKLGISAWSYLRFAPPLLSFLALVPLFLLAQRVSGSKLGGMVAAVLASGSFYLYTMQTESGGIVRALAFGMGLLALYFFDRMVISFGRRDAVLAGVFFGLTVLTHIGYAYFFAFWLVVWAITHPRKQTWIGAMVAAAVSVLVVLPWTILMLERYGVSVFFNAFQSHRSLQLISLIQNPVNLFVEYRINLSGLFGNPCLLLLVVGGLVLLVIQRKFTLPLLFLLILFFFYEEDQYILMVSYIIVGYFISSLYRIVASSKFVTNRPLERLISSLVLVGLFFPIYSRSFQQLGQRYPLINQNMLEMTQFLNNSTPAQTRYLALSTDENQAEEWLPYLSRREPVIAGWGSEWKGTFRLQQEEDGKLSDCINTQSLPCLDAWLLSAPKQPDYIVLDTSLKGLSVSLVQSTGWINVYSNSGYIIWKRR